MNYTSKTILQLKRKPFQFMVSVMLVAGFSCTNIYAQQPASASNINWRTNPIDHKIFIANHGQCNGAVPDTKPIAYHVMLGDIDAYFTASGMTYRCDMAANADKDLRSDEEREEAAEKGTDRTKTETHYLSAMWEGANPNVTIEALQPQTYYYTYTLGSAAAKPIHNIKAEVYKEIIYRNLYPGIDVDYTFPADNDKNRGTIKYTLIMHPGADISKVKLKYSGADNVSMDKQGNVLVKSVMGMSTEHAPVCFYKEPSTGNEKENAVTASYILSGDEESFFIRGDYDHTKTLVIDPAIIWSSNPAFTGVFDNALDVDYDNAGNVFVYGGSFKYQLIKLNSLGVVQWVWNCRMPAVIGIIKTVGNMAVNRNLGVSYVTAGFGDSIWKISPTGVLQGFYKDPAVAGTGAEDWKIVYNPAKHALIIGSGGRSQLLMLDTNLALINSNSGGNTLYCCHDIVLLALDLSWNSAYMVNGNNGADAGKDSLFQVPLPGLFPFTWVKYPTVITVGEINGDKYANPEATSVNDLNGIAASRNALYLYDGGTVWRTSLANGNVAGTMILSPKSLRWGGITVDHCDDLYVGFGPTVNMYAGLTFTPAGTISMAVNTDTIYDLKLGKDSSTTLYASGMGFVASISINSLCPVFLPITLTSFNCSPQAGEIQLDWSTATETNNKYFTIERSSDGINFSPLTTIPGAGNSSQTLYYKYIDAEPLVGNNYYRLTQTDFDGHTEEVGNTLCTGESNALIVSPNPSAGKYTVTLPSECIANPVGLTVYDMLGRQVYSSVMEGEQFVNLDLSQFASGLYILNVHASEKTFVAKLLISK